MKPDRIPGDNGKKSYIGTLDQWKTRGSSGPKSELTIAKGKEKKLPVCKLPECKQMLEVDCVRQIDLAICTMLTFSSSPSTLAMS